MSRLRVDRLQRTGADAVDMQVDDAECASLHGPSGSGKSLLLRAIADLDEADGEVWLDDRPRSAISAPAWRSQVMYLAAESHWWDVRVREHAPDWDVATLIALGFDEQVLAWEVARLSSGERQRLALARALAHRPKALLLDEPTANLDASNTARVEAVVTAWRQASGGCVLWVSHDPAQRQRVASRGYRINAGTVWADDDPGGDTPAPAS